VKDKTHYQVPSLLVVAKGGIGTGTGGGLHGIGTEEKPHRERVEEGFRRQVEAAEDSARAGEAVPTADGGTSGKRTLVPRERGRESARGRASK
jgi:hypothetical protein